MMLLKTGILLTAVLALLAPSCSTNPGSVARDPQCNNHGTLQFDGRCRCHNNWYGRKCENIRNVAPDGQGPATSGNHHPVVFNPKCNNHGTLSPDGLCHCSNGWFGRKCELSRNVAPDRKGPAPGDNHHPGVFHPKCNNHGTLSADGLCHCSNRWFGSKCELLNTAVGGPVRQPNGHKNPQVRDPECNNHGTLLAYRGCRCYGNWYGRKCELYKNSGQINHQWFDQRCEIKVDGKCRCRDSASQRRCEHFLQQHKATTHVQKSTSSSKLLAMTTNKPNAAKQSTILPSSVTSSTTTQHVSTPSTTPATPVPTSTKVVTSTVSSISSTMTSKSAVTSAKTTSATIPTTASATYVSLPFVSNSVPLSVPTYVAIATTALPPSPLSSDRSTTVLTQSVSTSIAKVTPALPTTPVSLDRSTTVLTQSVSTSFANATTALPPSSMSSDRSTTVLIQKKFPTVPTILQSMSTNPPPKTLPPVSTECAVCSGPAFLCEKLYAPKQCEPPNNYCINTIVNHKDGTKSVNRTCGNFDTCYREWFLGSSDNDKCRKFNAADEQRLDFQCTFCCVEDNCNIPLHPTDQTLYKPT